MCVLEDGEGGRGGLGDGGDQWRRMCGCMLRGLRGEGESLHFLFGRAEKTECIAIQLQHTFLSRIKASVGLGRSWSSAAAEFSSVSASSGCGR